MDLNGVKKRSANRYWSSTENYSKYRRFEENYKNVSDRSKVGSLEALLNKNRLIPIEEEDLDDLMEPFLTQNMKLDSKPKSTFSFKQFKSEEFAGGCIIDKAASLVIANDDGIRSGNDTSFEDFLEAALNTSATKFKELKRNGSDKVIFSQNSVSEQSWKDGTVIDMATSLVLSKFGDDTESNFEDFIEPYLTPQNSSNSGACSVITEKFDNSQKSTQLFLFNNDSSQWDYVFSEEIIRSVTPEPKKIAIVDDDTILETPSNDNLKKSCYLQALIHPNSVSLEQNQRNDVIEDNKSNHLDNSYYLRKFINPFEDAATAVSNNDPTSQIFDILEEQPKESLQSVFQNIIEDVFTQSDVNGLRCLNIHKMGTNWLEKARIHLRFKMERKRYRSVIIEYNHDNHTLQEVSPSSGVIKTEIGGRNTFTLAKHKNNTEKSISRSSTIISDDNENVINLKSDSTLLFVIDEIIQKNNESWEDYPIIDVNKDQLKLLIHDILTRIFQIFTNGEIPHLKIDHTNSTNCKFENNRICLKDVEFRKSKFIIFSHLGSRPKFLSMLYIMGKAFTLLAGNSKLSPREMFYEIKHIIPRQAHVNAAIEEVASLLKVGPWHLNIVSRRGLVFGDLKLVLSSGEEIDCNRSDAGTLIPMEPGQIIKVESNAAFILVLEKESIFQKLIGEDLSNKLPKPFLMITGKGSPDWNVRLFLRRISTMMKVPVFIFVDPDPYGIQIMMIYRFGCPRSAYLSEYLTVPHALWLGVFPTEITSCDMPNLSLNARDKKLVQNMRKGEVAKANPKIAEQLDYLLKNGKKGSIEGLIKNNTFLSQSYLPTKVFQKSFI